ncbi:MAG: 4Fe-4S dicluster domain-containing protein [Ignavibacteriales bacterium]
MYLPKLREIKEALSSLFSAPYTTRFPAEPFIPQKEYRGFPRFNSKYCVGCGACAQVCPAGAIEVSDDRVNTTRTLRINYFSCIQCGQCQENCITEKGVRQTDEYAVLATTLHSAEAFEAVTKELVLCDCCGEIIACRDHLMWVRDRLGAKAYSHPNFLLETQRLFSEVDSLKPKTRLRREDYIKEVCPKCRHKIVVADEF